MHTRLIVMLTLVAQPVLHGQARPTATRAATVQVGGGVSSADSGIYPNRFKGGFVFVDFDMTAHLGAELEVRQVDTPDGIQVYERTYELGVRYHRSYRRLEPFAKIMVGRGVFNYPHNAATLAYNLYAAGLGTDLRVTRRVNLRVEYEYQHWINFDPGTLSPSVVEAGAAYRF